MNTNAKHYEVLKVQPWEIMEKNFTTEEFVAYLKGNIIKYALRSKGQDLSDAEKIKHYAEKLIEVIEKKETDEFLEEDAERIYEAVIKPEEAINKHEFKVGDRVIVNKGRIDESDGTIVRVPMIGYRCPKCYIVQLDNKGQGWVAYQERDGVNCGNAWYASTAEMEPLKTPSKPYLTPALVPNVWYDASLYTVEKLSKLLPKDTLVQVTALEDNDRKVNLRNEKVKEARVRAVKQRPLTKDTRIGVTEELFVRRYFKVIKED